MANSKNIAGILGPSLMALSASEAANVNVWASDTPAGIYFNGAALFVAGLAIVREHNFWVRDWTLMVTVLGWSALMIGLFRMFAPEFHLREAQHPAVLLELTLPFMAGAFLTYHAYRRE
jgi:hypothetical protein